MSPEQFDNTKFGKGMKARHTKYGEGDIVGVDYDERLVNLSLPGLIGDNWCRCENVEVVE